MLAISPRTWSDRKAFVKTPRNLHPRRAFGERFDGCVGPGDRLGGGCEARRGPGSAAGGRGKTRVQRGGGPRRGTAAGDWELYEGVRRRRDRAAGRRPNLAGNAAVARPRLGTPGADCLSRTAGRSG